MAFPKKTLIFLCALIMPLAIAASAQTLDPSLQQPQAPQSSAPNVPEKRVPAAEHVWITNTVADDGRDESQQQTATANVNPTAGAEKAAEPEALPNEFQKFIFLSTGRQLPLFGHDLFRMPSTFAPVDRVPVTANYVIGPGDEVVIRGWGQIDIDYRGTVDRTGGLYIPKVGNVIVAGVQYKDLQPVIKSAIEKFYHGFELTVTLGRLRSIQVFVVGQARRPGSYTVSSLSTLVNAIFASGGPSESGSMRRIQLKRDGKVVTEFDLYDLFMNGDKSKDAQLLPGDVLYIPPVGPLVALAGSVNNQAVYELKGFTSLAQLIQLAGGLTTVAGGQKATVERIKEHEARVVEEFSLDSTGLSRPMQDGDVVTLRSLSPRFDASVTLRGNVSNPGRYPWREGMHVSDLIPSRDALITRSFWWAQGDLGQPPSDFAQSERNQMINPVWYSNGRVESKAPTNASTPSTAPADKPATAAPSTVVRKTPDEMSNRELSGDRFATGVRSASTDINWDYAVIQRLNPQNLTTSLIPFNLGRAIEGQSGNRDDLELQPRDVITIFSQRDLQVPEEKRTKFVRLEGEFVTSGIYEAEPGETLRHLVARVGGVTSNAYLFGSEFSRQSAREIQQTRLNEFVDQLELNVERRGSTKSENILSPEEAAALKESVDTQRNLVSRMRQLKASGRVVLGIKPSATDIDNLPDLVLEDGDRFVIPNRPAIVNVVGAVYNNNSFIFEPNRSFGYYLKRAGGGTRDADSGHAFVIRADGSIVNDNRAAGWFSGGIDSLKLLPGDTIVVPEKLERTTLIKGLKDWSQILAQFGLGAAAVITLTR